MQEPDHVEWLGDLGRYPDLPKVHKGVDHTIKVLQGKRKSPEIFFFIVPRRGEVSFL
jgi:hypothetical protein